MKIKQFSLLFILLALFVVPVQAHAQQPVVHAIMFWMDGCPHCEDVIQNVLPPLQQKYGDQFDLFMIEVKGQDDVNLLYQVAESYGIPRDGTGVPFLIIGEQVLVGSDQVRNQLPALVEDYLTHGGLDFPSNPLLADVLSASPSTPTPELVAQPQVESTPQPVSREASAPAVESSAEAPVKNNGFMLAAVVMVFMVLVTLYSLASLAIGKLYFHASWMEAAIPILSVIGLGVAFYLTYVETQSVQAICGPVGDCNAVQSSSYSKIWGILPVGLLGGVGYIAILAAWFVGRQRWGWLSKYAPVALFGMALFGTVFSIYLTYLELFVIYAVCIWCVSSAIIITLILLFSLNSTLQAFAPSDEEDLE
ncbi:Vitamin K epoxide reductase [Anaerolineales bacterium]|nr:Vitamin K epoxide reductase [Anaerolineales bacterium]